MQRTGRRNRPYYSLVVAEHRAAVKGKSIEKLGHYDPLKNPHLFEYKLERILHWIQHGASPSNTVARLLKGSGVQGMDRYIVEMVSRKKKSEQAAVAPTPPATSATAPATPEKPAADTPAKVAAAEPVAK